jgi:hypothetical protein
LNGPITIKETGAVVRKKPPGCVEFHGELYHVSKKIHNSDFTHTPPGNSQWAYLGDWHNPNAKFNHNRTGRGEDGQSVFQESRCKTSLKCFSNLNVEMFKKAYIL